MCLTVSTETSNLKVVGSSPTVGFAFFGKMVNSRLNLWVGDSYRITRIHPHLLNLSLKSKVSRNLVSLKR